MVIVDTGDEIDLSRMGSGGWSIPSITEDYAIEFKKNEAEYVLLVEKEAVWHRLNEDKFWKKNKCILITCDGQATRGVRRILQRMANELKLPIYVLVDNDPWGLYIYSVRQAGLDQPRLRVDAHGGAARRAFSGFAPATSRNSSCPTT